MLEIANIFNNFENSKNPKPQIMMKVKDLRKEKKYDYFRIYFK